MPSKYTAYLHFSQEDMNKLAVIDPSIVSNDGNIHKVIATVFDKLINGEYTKTTSDEIKLRREKLIQEIMKLKIQNKKALIHDLQINPETTQQVVEGKIPIEIAIGRPTDSPVKNVNEVSPYDEKNKIFECHDCGCLFPQESHQIEYLKEWQFKILNHIQEKHNRSCTQAEKDAFRKLGVPM